MVGRTSCFKFPFAATAGEQQIRRYDWQPKNSQRTAVEREVRADLIKAVLSSGEIGDLRRSAG